MSEKRVGYQSYDKMVNHPSPITDEYIRPFLQIHNLGKNQFHTIRNTVIDDIDDSNALRSLIHLRREIADIDPGVILEKVLAPSEVSKYYQMTYTVIRGFVARMQDVPHFTPVEYIQELGLYYPESPFYKKQMKETADVYNPDHQAHMVDHVYSLRTKASSYAGQDFLDQHNRKIAFRIPIGSSRFGNEFDEEIGAFHNASPPYTGTGITKSTNHILPEFYIDMRYQKAIPEPQRIANGDEIWLVTHDDNVLIARFKIGMTKKNPSRWEILIDSTHHNWHIIEEDLQLGGK